MTSCTMGIGATSAAAVGGATSWLAGGAASATFGTIMPMHARPTAARVNQFEIFIVSPTRFPVFAFLPKRPDSEDRVHFGVPSYRSNFADKSNRNGCGGAFSLHAR